MNPALVDFTYISTLNIKASYMGAAEPWLVCIPGLVRAQLQVFLGKQLHGTKRFASLPFIPFD
jgi:hypothetical protein